MAEEKPPNKGSITFGRIFSFLLLMIFIFFVMRTCGQMTAETRKASQELTIDQVYAAIDKDEIQELHLDPFNSSASGKLKIGGKPFQTPVADVQALEKKALEKGVRVTAEAAPSGMTKMLVGLIPWILIMLLIFWYFGRQAKNLGGGPGGIFSFSKHKAKWVDFVKTRFDDVQGCDEAKEEVREVIEFLKDPKKFSRLGGRVPRGVILFGPPGTGKTLLAKAVAGEAEVPFLELSGSDFVEMFVGVGASRVNNLFQDAKTKSPCVIFLDEIDAVGQRRRTALHTGQNDEREQTLNAILSNMDGFDTDEGVVVFAASNRPDILDPALLRPGRFDRHVDVPLPDIKGREAILRAHAKKIKVADTVDYRKLARMTPMRSGADLAAIVNEAAIIATRRSAEAVEQADFWEAAEKIMYGKRRKSAVVPEEDLEITAWHEAGHTLVLKHTPGTDPVHKVTIIPRGSAGGATFWLPERDRHYYTKSYAEAQLAVAMGGRIGEEMRFGSSHVSSGASDDFAKATGLAKAMVKEWGMSEAVGNRTLSSKSEYFGAMNDIWDCGPDLQNLVDKEVRRFLEEAYSKAKDILVKNREELAALAKALREKETLTGEEVDQIIASVRGVGS